MIDEEAVRKRVGQLLARELYLDGLVVDELDVQVYSRWDRRTAKLVVEAHVRPREDR